MRYPTKIQKNDVIGVCAPSSGVEENLQHILNNAKINVENLGYMVQITPSVWENIKCVSSDSKTRANEFLELYRNPQVKAIIPPWGGEFLMDILEYINFEELKTITTKWVSGYSDLTTLLFPMTILADTATIHGSNFMNMGQFGIDNSDLSCFEAMQADTIFKQNSFPSFGTFTEFGSTSKPVYTLDKPSEWNSLGISNNLSISGRMIGGCMDTMSKLIGTQYANITPFLNKYKQDGFIWTLESCEMCASDIYRSLWQMAECGWFKNCNGILYGRADGYSDNKDFTLEDAFANVFTKKKIPVIYNCDIGHIPPQIQIINGSLGTIDYNYQNKSAIITQKLV